MTICENMSTLNIPSIHLNKENIPENTEYLWKYERYVKQK